MLASTLLEGLSTTGRWILAPIAFCLLAGETYVFGRLGRETKANGGPGYNDFQRAGSADDVRRARDTWGRSGLAAARKAWLLDLTYPVTYALLGVVVSSLAASYAQAQHSDWLARTMEIVSWIAVAAGATDLLIENPAVAIGLWASPSDTAARIARSAGRGKLTLIATVLVALLVAFVTLLVT